MAQDDIGPPPEGGREAWLCVSGAFFVLFCIFGFATSFGQLKIYYLENQLKGYSESEVAWISSVQTFLIFACSIFSGRYFDSHGTRVLLLSGSVLFVGSLIGIAFCHNYWQLMLAHAGIGFSGAILYSPSTAVPGHWFLHKRSTAVGIVVCGSGLAGVIYPIMIKRLIELLNFRDALLIIAGMNAALMAFACFTMKARLPPRTPPPLKALLGPWSEPRYSCLVIGSCFIMTNWLSPYFNAPVYATSNNTSSAIASYSIAILQAGSFLGRALGGVMADQFGVWNMFTSFGLVAAISLFAFWTARPMPDAVVIIGLLGYGIGSGGWVTLVAASCGAISPVREFGMRLGMLWSLSSLGIIAGPVICGVLINSNDGGYTYAAIFCAMTTLIGIVVCLAPVAMGWIAGIVLSRREEEESKE